MEITGKSETTYNFNGIKIGADITEAEFNNKEAIIVISNFDPQMPTGCINYYLTRFGQVTEENLDSLIEEIRLFYNTNVWSEFPNKEPNYIGYYLEGDLDEIVEDIKEGEEYKRTFKIKSLL